MVTHKNPRFGVLWSRVQSVTDVMYYRQTGQTVQLLMSCTTDRQGRQYKKPEYNCELWHLFRYHPKVNK